MENPRNAMERCLQFQPPFCTAACPFALDVHDFTEKLKRGSFQAAYKTFQNAVGFPVLVSALCPAPCQGACAAGTRGEAVRLSALERAATAYCRSPDPVDYNVPAKSSRIAIVGAGSVGLACALRCAQKKYTLTVFEQESDFGGRLQRLRGWEDYRADILRQFQFETVDWQLGRRVESLAELAGFDAVLLATGEGGNRFGLTLAGEGFETNRAGYSIAAGPAGQDAVRDVAMGLTVFRHLEHFLKTGNMNRQIDPSGTDMVLDPSVHIKAASLRGTGDMDLTKEDAKAEAARCLRCRCDGCMRHCNLMDLYKKFPKRLLEEADATIDPSALDGTGMIGNRSISTCNLCGLCARVCPEHIDLGEFFLESRQRMQQRDTMPWPFHDYWLRDMAFANGEEARLLRLPPGGEACTHLYFPGCQLGGSDGRYVSESYGALLQTTPGTGFFLQCCGAPALWAGLEKERDEVFDEIRRVWERCGRPKLVVACPSCKKILGRYLPEIEGIFLYDLLPGGTDAPEQGRRACVFDPCSSREEPALQAQVRSLAHRAGYALEPLPYEGDMARCCSWGGHVSVANPAYADRVVRERIGESDAPYLTYCVNCRDGFAAAGKAVRHMLDVLLVPENGWDRPAPTPTARRENRRRLKADILKRFWGEELKKMDAKEFPLLIPPALQQKLAAALLLEEDVRQVVAFCEESGRKVILGESGCFAGHQRIGYTTVWVEYRPAEGGFELMRAYSHRMSIEEATPHV